MRVQTKILILLFLFGTVFLGGLAALQISARKELRAAAESRARDRDHLFEQFLAGRDDSLALLAADAELWEEVGSAVVNHDPGRAAEIFTHERIAAWRADAIWIYRPDGSLFYSVSGWSVETPEQSPLPPEALDQLLLSEAPRHFFLRLPLGLMEARGFRIRAQDGSANGYALTGHFFLDENLRRISQFTGTSLRVLAPDQPAPPDSGEEVGQLRFSRILPGWNGDPVASLSVENDSPLFRQLKRTSERLLLYQLLFGANLLLVLFWILSGWVRRPLVALLRNLRAGDAGEIESLRERHDELGELADAFLKFRFTAAEAHPEDDRLQHSQRLAAIGRLAGGVAHDFNNLLTAIIGYADLLVGRLADDAAGRQQAETIRRAGEQAANLTRQLLAFSRKQLLQPRVMDLNQLVRAMHGLLGRVVGRNITIVIRARADDPRIFADPNQIEQVILNLAVNARDAMAGGGTLTIETDNVVMDTSEATDHDPDLTGGDYVVLSVSDTGSGMDEKTQAQLFEPFFTTKGPGKGSGLGLATVYGIVKQSRGGIAVESELERGTVFSVLLPKATEEIEPAPEVPPPGAHPVKAETILAVEDEEVVRDLICSVLSDAGYNVICASKPSEAFTLVEEYPDQIDILVTDVMMPEMHGPEMAQRLCIARPGLRVLYISGYSGDDLSEQGVLHPNLEVLQKPFTHRAFLRRIREVLDRPPGENPAGPGPSGLAS